MKETEREQWESTEREREQGESSTEREREQWESTEREREREHGTGNKGMGEGNRPRGRENGRGEWN
jgi:hypothetical protein